MRAQFVHLTILIETDDMMAASIQRRKIYPVSKDDLSIPSPRQASSSQSQCKRRVESVERQHLIGDGHSDWMTEKVDLSSFVSSTSESSPSSSLPPSPLEQDVKVPSDLEVMTSLLQEELAQLEDYFRSESTPLTKLEKSSKCDKATHAMGTQSYYQLPYASYNGSQSETSPVVVTLATGELDLASFCGGPVARPKMARPAPYSYHRYHHNNNNNRRIIADAVKVGEVVEVDAWGCKGSYSGNSELSGNHYSTLKTVGKSCIGNVKKNVRECALSLKEEGNYCFTEGMFCGDEMARGFCLGGSYDCHLKREGHLMHNAKGNVSYDCGTTLEVLHCSKDERGGGGGGLSIGPLPPETMSAGDAYFQHQTMPNNTEPYHSFIGELEQPSQAHALEPQHGHYLYPECLADQSYECLSSRGEREGPLGGGLSVHLRQGHQRLKEDPCALKAGLLGSCPLEAPTGERKQKKRDQNKTAAHRYRLRKRAELDTLEEELHGLEGQNRELRDKAESVEREIQYVKDLLIEVYKARSQRQKQDGSA